MEALASPLSLLIKSAPSTEGQGSVAGSEPGEIPVGIFAALLAQQMGVAAPGEVTLEAAAALADALNLDTGANNPELPPDQAAAPMQLPLAMQNAIPITLPVPKAMTVMSAGSMAAAVTEAVLPDRGGPQQVAGDVEVYGMDDTAGNGGARRQAVAGEPASFAVSAGNARTPDGDSRFLRGIETRFEQPVIAGMLNEMPASATPPTGTMPMLRPAADTAPVQASSSIAQPVTSDVWGNKLGERVVWMVGQQHQGVELHLNPPSLGPLEIKLSMSDNTASLTFSTQHPPVREAIEGATARLREMLAESGISLGGVSVNVGNFTQQQPSSQSLADGRGQAPAWTGSVASEQPMPQGMITPLRHNGMVDIFA